MHLLRSLKLRTTVEKHWLLDRLRENRESHANLFNEARAGYITRATARLQQKLDQLKAGQVTDLQFNLSVPTEHTREYDTVIGMIQNHTEPTIELGADEYRMFVEDLWDWTQSWYTSNAHYSPEISTKSLELGFNS